MTATLLLAAVLLGQPPAPVPAASIDALIDKVIELRAKKAEIEKAEGATTAELQAKTRALLDRLAQLGVTPQPAPGPQPGPTPPPPPADPFVTELQQLYAADTGADKAKALASLMWLYRQAEAITGEKIKGPDGAETTTFKVNTAGELLAAISSVVAGDETLTPKPPAPSRCRSCVSDSAGNSTRCCRRTRSRR